MTYSLNNQVQLVCNLWY